MTLPLSAVVILAGSIMVYQGGRKSDDAEGARHSGVGPMLMDGEVRGAQAVVTF